ncbi:glycoside hydrolase family 36 protein [Sphingomonas sp. LM7]|uniref:glycoside hydrolase family 36 protein n=1 Tax=Sphingomonas sp. LM7 TaxID=1938607 RepID=UPI000983A545|nr:glycoside hydrolase family 36 protein [Sphingomonas sp. LM7]AQR75058.1 alpha-galactosidase [Sphingomonas sp. LM7]
MMQQPVGGRGHSRRTMLRWMAGAASLAPALAWSRPLLAASTPRSTLEDKQIRIEFDDGCNSRVTLLGGTAPRPLSAFSPSETLHLADGTTIARFICTDTATTAIAGPHGRGRELRLTGIAAEGVEKIVSVRLHDRHPGFALVKVRYRNTGTQPLKIGGWSSSAHIVAADADGAWTFAGSSHSDRRDWIQPVKPGFDQRNFMGMNATDYGGGTPCADVWTRTGGLAVGHVETVPLQLALPVTAVPGGTRVAIEGSDARVLAPGDMLETPETFLAAHRGDCFQPLSAYGRVMAERGLAPAPANDECFETNWCAWGYERGFTPDQVVGTLPKVRELGFRWAVIDDGWQTSEGDWYLDPAKFPGGDADMKAMVQRIRAAGLKPKLWIAPLAVDPGTDLLRYDTDMLLLDADGQAQDVTWWNSFYLCPAYPKTVEKSVALVRKIFGEWGFAGLKIDGHHLNGVAPCHNKAHNHARPEESIEKLQEYWKALFDAATAIDPDAVIELCPCGTSYSYHNMIGQNQSVASDPLSSWQIRLKGKAIRALAGGTRTAYSGDHVELSDGGVDFASTVAIGAIPFSKFTWPVDPKPKDSFLLTPERETVWRKWLDLYQAHMLPKGTYRGELYDIGFDRPEAHVVAKDGALYYGFFAAEHAGEVELRGLGKGRYRVRDLFAGRDLGVVSAAAPRLAAGFTQFLFLEARPLKGRSA